ncbi:uncharacterized protein LOC124948711 [Vespa velutina]|uniref:uncharacterized protein LOC124948711 n=1 Tax=Vespa velutina TaxID=202808 RepID=UPI001FB35499|nr:uncharacterized protein LOC124948711 [Vespa velutina]
MIIILYAYIWFSTTFIWECCMIIVTVLMLTISTFSLIYDYYDDDGASDIYIDKHTQHEGRSFAISLGLATISIVILIIDLVLLIIKTGKGGAGNGRLHRGGGATHARTAEIAE